METCFPQATTLIYCQCQYLEDNVRWGLQNKVGVAAEVRQDIVRHVFGAEGASGWLWTLFSMTGTRCNCIALAVTIRLSLKFIIQFWHLRVPLSWPLFRIYLRFILLTLKALCNYRNYRSISKATERCWRPPKADVRGVVICRKAAEWWWRSANHRRLMKSEWRHQIFVEGYKHWLLTQSKTNPTWQK